MVIYVNIRTIYSTYSRERAMAPGELRARQRPKLAWCHGERAALFTYVRLGYVILGNVRFG